MSRKIWDILTPSFFIGLLIGQFLTGCQVKTIPLSIAAAASLKDGFQAIGNAYEKHYQVKPQFYFAASGTLRKQIELGAHFDIFASASAHEIDMLVKKKRLQPESRMTFAHNRLVIVSRQNSGLANLSDLKQLQTLSRIALGNPVTVPAGKYAKEALQSLQLWDILQKENRLIVTENVRQVVDYINRGEVDVGFVYQSDYHTFQKRLKRLVTISPTSHSPILFQAGLPANGLHTKEARRFLSFLTTPEAQKYLHQFGFEPAVKP